jgi:hypothetical protein
MQMAKHVLLIVILGVIVLGVACHILAVIASSYGDAFANGLFSW